MSISRSFIVNGTLTSRPIGFNTLSPNSSSNLAILKFKDQSLFWALQSLQCVKKNTGTQKNNNNQRNFVVYCVDPAVPPPSGPPFNFLNWILGFTVSVVLPFFSHKWGSLLKLKNKVETTVETIEHVADAVEKVAEEVEKVAEDIVDDLPKGGKLRNMVDFVEHMAEEVAKDAHQVEEFIDKVQRIIDRNYTGSTLTASIQETEERMETFVESLVDEAKEPPKEGNEETLASKPS